MGGLEHSLEMGRIPLYQWELIAEAVQRHAPGQRAAGPGDLEETVKPASHGGGKGQVSRHVERCGVARREVLPKDRGQDNPRFARLGGYDSREQSELITFRGSAPLYHDGAQEREAQVGDLRSCSVEVALFRLQNRPLEPGERAA